LNKGCIILFTPRKFASFPANVSNFYIVQKTINDAGFKSINFFEFRIGPYFYECLKVLIFDGSTSALKVGRAGAFLFFETEKATAESTVEYFVSRTG
jgi:hypothetical protein